jgi:hypothetical protein
MFTEEQRQAMSKEVLHQLQSDELAAVMTGLQGQLSDVLTNVRLSFLVPLVCFCVVLIYTFTLKIITNYFIRD